MSDLLPGLRGSIAKHGTQAGTDAADEKHTTIGFEGSKTEGGEPEIMVSVDHERQGEKVSVGFGAWFKRKFMRGGSSAGVKGQIKF